MTRGIGKISILGAGPAGLAVGYYAHLQSIPFTIYEKADRSGGNCITYEWDSFRYDSGAHRIHGTDPEIVEECARLLGGHLYEVDIPSRVYTRGRQFIFPLTLKNIIRNMPPADLWAGMIDFFRAKSGPVRKLENFQDLAIRRYGRRFAREFLLDYSEKLWGMPCDRLDTSLAGKRLEGLNVWSMAKELIWKNRRPQHMEGRFFYPEGGIGRLTEALAESLGRDSIRPGAAVTRIFHDGNRITAIEINGREQHEVDTVVSSIPINQLLSMLTPQVALTGAQERFHFRNLIIVALFVDKNRITDAASLYFPGDEFPFTRAYEPRNRCASMSPPGRTSLVSEIPCDAQSLLWTAPDQQLISMVVQIFCTLGWLKEENILGAEVRRMSDAYPVRMAAHGDLYHEAEAALTRFSNLKITGRCGRFTYSWIHDQMRWGREIVRELSR